MKKLLAILFFSSTQLLISAQEKNTVDEGLALFRSGEYNKAVDAFDNVLEKDSLNLIALYHKAAGYYKLEEYKKSIEVSKYCLDNFKDTSLLAMVYASYGASLKALGDEKEAVDILDDGIDAYPDYYLLYYNRGLCNIALDDNEDAIEDFELAVQKNPSHASSNFALAALNFKRKKNIPALMAYVRFLTLESNSQRAKKALENVEEILMGGVRRDGVNSFTINLDPGVFNTDSTEENPENYFSNVEMLLAFSAAIDYDEKFESESMSERFMRKIASVISVLSESVEDNHGFYWKFYAPYFIDLDKFGFTETLSKIVYRSKKLKDETVVEWIADENNLLLIKSFYDWSNGYPWQIPGSE